MMLRLNFLIPAGGGESRASDGVDIYTGWIIYVVGAYMYRLKIFFSQDRKRSGILTFYNTLTGVVEFGPIPCLGLAKQRDQTKYGGDTPTGRYQVTGKRLPDPAKPEFGPNPRLTLKGIDGNALKRDKNYNGDALLRIHGGRMSPSGKKDLKYTMGCVRVFDYDMLDILRFIADKHIAFPFDLEILEDDYTPIVDIGSDATGAPDPDDIIA